MQLLDAAAFIVETNGLSSLTIEEVAQKAGVSHQLVYKYFDTRMSLLQELLIREYDRYDHEFWHQIESAKNYREVVEMYVRINFEQAERANILEILRGQADIRSVIQGREKIGARKTDEFLVDRFMREFEVSVDIAAQLVATGSGASIAAARHRQIYGGEKEEMIQRTMKFIFSGFEAALKEIEEK